MAQLFVANDGDYVQLPWGVVEFHNNELHLKTSVNDPAGLSFRGADGCKVSWKDDNGREKALLQLRRNPQNNGEFYFGCLDEARYAQLVARGDSNALDHAMIEVFTLSATQAEFRVPVKLSAGATGSLQGVTDTLWSPDGMWFVQQQTDGNFVKYGAVTPFQKAPVTSADLIG
jgi:hypothetical protein